MWYELCIGEVEVKNSSGHLMSSTQRVIATSPSKELMMNYHFDPGDNSLSKSVEGHWDDFYRQVPGSTPQSMPPSQFAAFCCVELRHEKVSHIVEMASGDGRDTLFFANQGFQVSASEKSAEAVNLLKTACKNIPGVSVMKLDAVNEPIKLAAEGVEKRAFYARFFLHTLSKDDIERFFANLDSAMRPGECFFTEYRNEKEACLEKVTPQHFREFHESKLVSQICYENNLDCIYGVEGVGFAKWKADDAHVTRQIFKKRAL